MTVAEQRHPDTIEDFLARADNEPIELIRGTIVQKASPSSGHGRAQFSTALTLGPIFQRPGGGRSGGWIFFSELDVKLGGEVFRPDICGYRRERVPPSPEERLTTVVPDWICEILSPSNESRDRIEKMETYFRSGLPHFWLLNPVAGTLEVFRRTDLAFARVQAAHRGQRVRAEPFDSVELSVDDLLGDDSAQQ